MFTQSVIKLNLAVVFLCRLMSALLLFGLYRLVFSDPFLASHASGWVVLYIAIAGISTMDLGVGAALKNSLIGDAAFAISLSPFLWSYSAVGLVVSLMFSFFVILSTPSLQLIIDGGLFSAALIFCVAFIYPMVRFGVSYHQAKKREWLVAPVFVMVNLLLIFLVWFASLIESVSFLVISLPIAFIAPLFLLFIYRFNPIWEPHKTEDNRVSRFEYLALGKPFIIIQIAVFVLITLNDALIARFAEGDLRDYQVLYRYFSIMSIMSSIISMVIWSNVGRKALEFDVKFRINSILISALGLSLCWLVMLFLTDRVVFIWLGDSLEVEGAVRVSLFCLAQSMLFIVAGFLNAQGRIGSQARWLGAIAIIKVFLVVVSLSTTLFDASFVISVSAVLLSIATLRLSILYIFES